MSGKTFDLPTTKAELQQLSGMVREISNAMAIIESAREKIKDVKTTIKENFDLPPKAVSLMVKLYHSQTGQQYFEEQDDFELLYDKLFGGTEDDQS